MQKTQQFKTGDEVLIAGGHPYAGRTGTLNGQIHMADQSVGRAWMVDLPEGGGVDVFEGGMIPVGGVA
jgi:hypothetical protein